MSCDKEKLCIKLVLTYTDAAGELVVKARAGDHGKFLVDAAEKSDKLNISDANGSQALQCIRYVIHCKYTIIFLHQQGSLC